MDLISQLSSTILNYMKVMTRWIEINFTYYIINILKSWMGSEQNNHNHHLDKDLLAWICLNDRFSIPAFHGTTCPNVPNDDAGFQARASAVWWDRIRWCQGPRVWMSKTGHFHLRSCGINSLFQYLWFDHDRAGLDFFVEPCYRRKPAHTLSYWLICILSLTCHVSILSTI